MHLYTHKQHFDRACTALDCFAAIFIHVANVHTHVSLSPNYYSHNKANCAGSDLVIFSYRYSLLRIVGKSGGH